LVKYLKLSCVISIGKDGMPLYDKENRILEIFFRGIRGEDLSPAKLAAGYGVSRRSITRRLNEIKAFLAENRELVGHAELAYNHRSKAYRLFFDEFLSDKELFAAAKIIIGSRAFSRDDAALIISKLKRFAAYGDQKKLEEIIRRELLHYSQIKHDCDSVIDNLWELINAITDKREITISYYKMDRTLSDKRIQPVSIMFSEYYFYLIAYYTGKYDEPRYFRVDRVKHITVHHKRFDTEQAEGFDEGNLRRQSDTGQPPGFDEGELRRRNQFMFYGKLRRIQFWFSGPSVQAVLDRLPTARVVGREPEGYLLEAEVYGDGIKMFLLSQGAWVKVVAPEEFVEEMTAEVCAMAEFYKQDVNT